MLTALERVKKVLEISMKKVNEILEGEIQKTSPSEVTVAEEIVAEPVAEIEEMLTEEGTPPEPKATKPRAVGRRGAEGKVNKSELVRDYFKKNPEARNQEVIEHIKEKHGIELQPSLVSTVKISMNLPKSRPGRIKGSKKAKVSAVRKEKKSRDGLSMTACVTKVMSKSKKGMHVDEVLDRVKSLYKYTGEKGEDGLKNVIYQALYALSLKKSRRGWEGSAPVVIHDDHNHTWKMNPKAKRKIA